MQFVYIVVRIVTLSAARVSEPERVAHVLQSAHVGGGECQIIVDQRVSCVLLLVVVGRASQGRHVLLR